MEPVKIIDQFRIDLSLLITGKQYSQLQLAKLAKISQPAISNFLNGRRGLSCFGFLALWPFVYGAPFPEKSRDA